MKLHAHALGLTLGVIWGLAIFLVGLTSHWFDYGTELVTFFSGIYIGYGAAFGGAVIGGVWAFIDAYIAGALAAWLYNKFSKK